ncbi:MAG: hypothetical protein ACI32P_03215 [Catenibacterium mitsuokai]
MKVKYIGKIESNLSVLTGHTYECLGKELSMYRIIDESDEDYLYPCEEFEIVKDESKIEIRYGKSLAGEDNCFSIQFYLKDYIPERYFKIEQDGFAAELYFYIDLFKERMMFSGDKKDVVLNLDDYFYKCSSNMGNFTMVFDSAYDMVDFAVEESETRERISKLIKQLVEKKIIS